MNEDQTYKKENEELEKKIESLEREISFLKDNPSLSQGFKGEKLVATLVGGLLTDFATSYDVELPNKLKIEVKFSKLNKPHSVASKNNTRRWNWSNIFGWKNNGKDYDLLLLVGEKDNRYPDQYLDDSPYVFFLIPKKIVSEVTQSCKPRGVVIGLTTNFERLQSVRSKKILHHMISTAILKELWKSTTT